MSKPHILITGGAGYIGSMLTQQLLTENYTVTVLDSLYYNQDSLFHLMHNKNLNFVLGDVRNNKLLKGLISESDIIIPLACLVGAPLCDKYPDEAIEINLDAVRKIIDYKNNDQYIIFPTTNSGYGTKSNEVYCDERTPLDPISIYGKSKTDAEKAILADEGNIAFRLATVFGMSSRMRTDLLVNDFVFQAYKNKSLTLYEKDFMRNYVHILDVVDCISFTIKNYDNMKNNVFNLGLNDANLSKYELALLIKKFIPELEIKINEFHSDVDKRNYIVSNDKLKSFGFEAKRSIEDGIKELIKGIPMFSDQKYGNI